MGVSRSGSASILMLGPAAARSHVAAPSDEPERAAVTPLPEAVEAKEEG
jgi:hypothetical protein